MRWDMHEVVIERPRCGPRGRRRGVKWDLRSHDPELIPTRESTSRHRGGTKHLSDVLGPLKRFLDGAVGRPWDDVYSELRAGLSPDSLLHNHILEHVRGMVGLDGRGWNLWRVCPRTGRLERQDRRGWTVRDPGRADDVSPRRFLLRRVGSPWAEVLKDLERAGGSANRVAYLVRTEVVRVRRGARPGRVHALIAATALQEARTGAPLPRGVLYVEDGLLKVVP